MYVNKFKLFACLHQNLCIVTFLYRCCPTVNIYLESRMGGNHLPYPMCCSLQVVWYNECLLLVAALQLTRCRICPFLRMLRRKRSHWRSTTLSWGLGWVGNSFTGPCVVEM